MGIQSLEGLATRLGEAAVDPLLDWLETARDQTSHARPLRALVQIGPAAVVEMMQRWDRRVSQP